MDAQRFQTEYDALVIEVYGLEEKLKTRRAAKDALWEKIRPGTIPETIADPDDALPAKVRDMAPADQKTYAALRSIGRKAATIEINRATVDSPNRATTLRSLDRLVKADLVRKYMKGAPRLGADWEIVEKPKLL